MHLTGVKQLEPFSFPLCIMYFLKKKMRHKRIIFNFIAYGLLIPYDWSYLHTELLGKEQLGRHSILRL